MSERDNRQGEFNELFGGTKQDRVFREPVGGKEVVIGFVSPPPGMGGAARESLARILNAVPPTQVYPAKR